MKLMTREIQSFPTGEIVAILTRGYRLQLAFTHAERGERIRSRIFQIIFTNQEGKQLCSWAFPNKLYENCLSLFIRLLGKLMENSDEYE